MLTRDGTVKVGSESPTMNLIPATFAFTTRSQMGEKKIKESAAIIYSWKGLTLHASFQVGDFGISKSLATTLAQAMTRIGTPYYLSPEVRDNALCL